MTRSCVWVVGLLGLLLAGSARATACLDAPVPTGIDRADTDLRIAFLMRTLTEERNRVNVWSWSWGSAGIAGTLGQGGAAIFVKDHLARADLLVATGSTALGTVLTFIVPLGFASRVGQLERSTGMEDRCALLSLAERILDEGVEAETLGRSWMPHVGSLLVNTGVVLILGLFYGRWQSGLISGAVGIALSEAQLFSRPAHLAEARMHYRSGRPWKEPPHFSWQVAPMFGPGSAGVMAVFTH